MTLHYVQYGTGNSPAEGFRNFDSSPTLRFERIPFVGKLYSKNGWRFPENVEYGDIVKGLPIAHNSLAGIYSSHVLEHLSLDDFRVAIANSYSYLRTGGLFRLCMPDLELMAREYLASRSDQAAIDFCRMSGMAIETRQKALIRVASEMFGSSRHLWLWDYKSTAAELAKIGFRSIRRAEFGDSSDQMFLSAERRDRWDNCLGLECAK